jgi:hypothetical protein
MLSNDDHCSRDQDSDMDLERQHEPAPVLSEIVSTEAGHIHSNPSTFVPAPMHQLRRRRHNQLETAPPPNETMQPDEYAFQTTDHILQVYKRNAIRWFNDWVDFHRVIPDDLHGGHRRRYWYGTMAIEACLLVCFVLYIVYLASQPVVRHSREIQVQSSLATGLEACKTIASNKRTSYGMFVPINGDGTWFACLQENATFWTVLWINGTAEWSVDQDAVWERRHVRDPVGGAECEKDHRFASAIRVAVIDTNGPREDRHLVHVVKSIQATALQFMFKIHEEDRHVECFTRFLNSKQ